MSETENQVTPEEQVTKADLESLHATISAEVAKSISDTIEMYKPRLAEALAAKLEELNSEIANIKLTIPTSEAVKLMIQEAMIDVPVANNQTSDTTEMQDFLAWANKREKLYPKDTTFYVYEESLLKSHCMLDAIRQHIDTRLWPQLLYSLTLHYVICEDYTYIDEAGFEQKNPLYTQYKIGSKSFIVSSASDESSSSSIHTTKSLNEGDFTMQDLLRTKYGQYVYSVLEQLDVSSVLL